MRERLPATREGIIHRFVIFHPPTESNKTGQTKGHLILNKYPDGRLGEGFLYLNTVDEGMRGFARVAMTLFSVSLQNSEALRTVLDKFSFHRFEPAGFTDNPEIPTCTSIPDYINRFIHLKFPGLCGEAHLTSPSVNNTAHSTADNPGSSFNNNEGGQPCLLHR